MKKTSSKLLMAVGLGIAVTVVPTQLMAKKPNILVMWGDDVGYSNASAYNQGMMGYKTPNIDSIVRGTCGKYRRYASYFKQS